MIHCDEFGRVRVQFHWDRYGKRDQFSSCWIHVNQPWAGDGFGMVNIPRIGQEVIVDFLGGNPDEPMILGRMHTNLLRPSMALPANKTQSGFKSQSVPQTGGYNEMIFEDKAGQELIRMRAEKDWNTRVNNNQATDIGNTRSTKVASHDTEAVGGNQKQSVGGTFDQTIMKDAMERMMQNMGSFVGGSRVFGTQEGFSSNAKSHSFSSDKSITLQVGSSTIVIGPDSIIVQAGKVLLNPGESAVQDASVMGMTPNTGVA
jgi:type VI secretion system secreted protein VgrG